MSKARGDVWRAFVGSALALSVIFGFGLGGGLFATAALDRPSGAWWPAAAQAHGHIQYAGWAGLMVLGVGLHFLPRLAGAPFIRPERAHLVLGLLLSGLVVRALAQPWLAEHPEDAIGTTLRVSLGISAIAELAGVTLAISMLGRAMAGSQNLRRKPELRAALPLFALALCGFSLALVANTVGVFEMVTGRGALIDRRLSDLTIQLAFYAFLVPISIAMSARTLPLYVRTVPPRPSGLRALFALMAGGLLLRTAGDLFSESAIGGVGRLVQASALLYAILVLGVVGRRIPLPRSRVRVFADPVQLHVVAAYFWLAFAGVFLMNAGLDTFGFRSFDVAETVEWHGLGAGFVTILILGVGQVLLPGFARRPLLSRKLLWATLVLGNAAVILRLVPVLADGGLQHGDTTLAVSGFLGAVALGVFAGNAGLFHWQKEQC